MCNHRHLPKMTESSTPSTAPASAPAPAKEAPASGGKLNESQIKKMNDVMSAELRALKNKMAEIEAEAKRVASEKEDLAQKFSKAQESLDVVKEEKKHQFGSVIDKSVKPFIDELRENVAADAMAAKSISLFENHLNDGLQDGFMDPMSRANYEFAAVASAATQRYKSDLEKVTSEHQITSSKLEKLFQAEKEWQEKLQAIQAEKEAIAAEKENTVKSLEEANALKDKMVADLENELKALGAIQNKNIANTKSHFDTPAETETSEPVPVETETLESAAPTAVEATASSSSDRGLGSLISFERRTDWRRSYD